MTFDHIAVVGAGAWGTALANAIARAGRAVLLATRDRAGADMLVKTRQSPRLPACGSTSMWALRRWDRRSGATT